MNQSNVREEWERIEKQYPGRWRLAPLPGEGWHWAKFPTNAPEIVRVVDDQWGVGHVWRVGHAIPTSTVDCMWGERVADLRWDCS